MKGVKYIAPYLDHSGYGEASRNYILALHEAGVPLTIEPRRFESNPPPVGTEQERRIFHQLETNGLDFDTVIVHLTPDLAPDYKKKYPDKYMISYTVWETSLTHPFWAKCCNQMDEVWVPCDWNIQAFRDSGVTVPMYKIHHGIDPAAYTNISTSNFALPNHNPDSFVFYSIFQWNSRKNPEGLLRSYFNAFTGEDNVRLIMKTYVGRGLPAHEESRQIREVIQRIKADMQLQSYPRLSLITDSLSTEKMRALNMLCDAYVSLTHGEGFGLTMLEAGLAGKPVIATGMGGNMEYMNADNSYPVPFDWGFVTGMGSFNPWYWGNQQWGNPNLPEASRLMRHVFDNREEANEKGRLLQRHIKDNFNWRVVGKQMVDRLKEL